MPKFEEGSCEKADIFKLGFSSQSGGGILERSGVSVEDDCDGPERLDSDVCEAEASELFEEGNPEGCSESVMWCLDSGVFLELVEANIRGWWFVVEDNGTCNPILASKSLRHIGRNAKLRDVCRPRVVSIKYRSIGERMKAPEDLTGTQVLFIAMLVRCIPGILRWVP